MIENPFQVGSYWIAHYDVLDLPAGESLDNAVVNAAVVSADRSTTLIARTLQPQIEGTRTIRVRFTDVETSAPALTPYIGLEVLVLVEIQTSGGITTLHHASKQKVLRGLP